jgi:hypothetical protein
MSRRQSARVQEEPIPEELIANIPTVGSGATVEAEVSFSAVEDEQAAAAPPEGAPLTPSALAQQLRYEMGEAFARELDRAEQTLNGALADLEARVAAAEAALAEATAQATKEREAREAAEARLKAFKELALK